MLLVKVACSYKSSNYSNPLHIMSLRVSDVKLINKTMIAAVVKSQKGLIPNSYMVIKSFKILEIAYVM